MSPNPRVITELFNVGGERIWLIQLRDCGEIIGTCGFRPLAPHSRDFGYCLGPGGGVEGSRRR
jgi:RimJ/RimL family protein N-acetyltransferase